MDHDADEHHRPTIKAGALGSSGAARKRIAVITVITVMRNGSS